MDMSFEAGLTRGIRTHAESVTQLSCDGPLCRLSAPNPPPRPPVPPSAAPPLKPGMPFGHVSPMMPFLGRSRSVRPHATMWSKRHSRRTRRPEASTRRIAQLSILALSHG